MKRQANILSSIIQNFDTVESVIQASADSTGSALKENEKYLDSIEGRVQQFTNSLQVMWNNLISSDIIKMVVNLGTLLTKIIGKLGLVGTAGVAGFTAIALSVTKTVLGTDSLKSTIVMLLKNLVTLQSSGDTIAQVWKNAVDVFTAGTAGVAKFTGTLKALWSTTKAFLETTAGKLVLITAAVAAVVAITDKLIVTTKEKEEAFQELNNALQDTKNKLSDLTTQLKETNSAIDELLNKPSLTFVEQEELERLQKQSEELRRQIDLQKALEKSQQKKANNQAFENIDDYMNVNFKSGKGKNDYIESGAKISGGIGAGVGAVALGSTMSGAVTSIATGALAGTKLGSVLGSAAGPIGTAIGAAIGVAIGAAVGAIIGDVTSEVTTDVGESIDKMYENRQKLQEDYNNAYKKYIDNPDNKKAVKNYEEAEKALSNYDSTMANHLNKLNEYKNSIDLSVYDSETESEIIEQKRQEINNIDDILNKYAILNGDKNAKSNAIANIFGENATNKIQKVSKELKRMAEEGEDIDLEKAFDTSGLNKADLKEFSDRLHKMGIYVYEVEDAFKQAAEAAQDMANTDVYDASKDVGATSSGIEAIKSAFDEVNEKGYVTSNTISELEKTLGNVDQLGNAWTNYQNIMSSATASTEEMKEATEELVKAYLDSQINFAEGPITNDQAAVYIKQLKDMGVKNSEEYINGRLEESMYNEIKLTATYDKNSVEKVFKDMDDDVKKELGIIETDFSKLNDEEIAKIAQRKGIEKQINADTAQEIANRYGIEIDSIDSVISKLEELANAQQTYNNLKAQQEAYDSWKKEYDDKTEEIEEIDERIRNLNGFNPSDYSPGNTQGRGHGYYNTDDSGKIISFMSTSEYNTALQQVRDLKEEGINYEEEVSNLNAKLSERNELLQQGKGLGYVDADGNVKPIELDVDGAEADVEELNDYIENNLTDKVDLDMEITGLGSVGSVLDTYASKMQTLADLQSELGNSFTLSAQKLREFAATYPELLAMAKDAGNGQMKFNKDVVNSFIEGKRTELDATIDTAVAGLQMKKSELEAEKAFAEAQLSIVEAALKSEVEGEQEKAILKIAVANQVVQKLIEMGVAEDEAYRLVAENMAKNTQEWGNCVANASSASYKNMDSAATGMATSIYNNMLNGAKSVYGLGQQASNTASQIDGIDSGTSGISSWVFNGTTGSSNGPKRFTMDDFTFNGADVGYYDFGKFDLEDIKIDLQLDVSELDAAITQIDGQIALLESYKDIPVKEFGSDSGSGSGSGGGDSGKDDEDDKPTAKELFDALADEFDRKISELNYKKDLIQSEIDKAEARGEVASESYYQRQIELEEQNRQALINKKKALEDYLEAQGKNMTKEEWADAQEEINNTALAIKECEQNVIDLGQAIDDIHWEYFDKFTSEVDDLGDENSTMLSLVGDTDDAVDENGNWTASGVTQIGLNTQEMQRNLEMANQMQKEKDNVQKSWNAYQRVLAKHGGDADKVTEKEKKKIQDKYGVLITSEGEYQEKMQEVSQKQRDYAKAAKDSRDAIEALAKARVDKEIEAIEEEIDAYRELIDLKKKELDAERD